MRGSLFLCEYSLGCIHSGKLLICLVCLVGWCFFQKQTLGKKEMELIMKLRVQAP
jgi:hypothetical protein